MRVLGVVFALPFLVVVVAAQAPASKAAQAPASKPAAARPPSSKPDGTLAMVMRGILFPNSNIIFDTQTNDPGVEKKGTEAGGGALATFANIYTGWQVIENAAVALAEAPDLIMKPGRLCQNGKPVPVGRADFAKAAQGLRDAGRAALKAAKSKNLDAMVDVSGQLTEACAACHETYRDKGEADSPKRCVP